jgi:two-component system cell cycle sensor histidine kinase/response regulator CckA
MAQKPSYQDLLQRIQELEENEQYYRLITENSSDMISKHAPDGTYIFASQASVNLIGYEPAELVGRNPYDLFHPDDKAKVHTSHQTILNKEIVSLTTYRIRNKDGHYTWVETTSKTIRHPETKEILEIIAITRNVDERMQMEEQIASQNRLMSTMLDNLDVGVFMVEAPSGKPLLANRRAQELLGRGIMNGAEKDTLAEVYQAYRADTDKLYPQEQMPVVLGLEGVSGSVDDMYVVTPGGRKILLEVYGSPVKDAEGNVIASIASFADITRRKEAERAQRESDKRLKLALDSVSDAVWDWNVATNQVYYSSRWYTMLGYEPYEMPQEFGTWQKLLHPDDLPSAEQVVYRHLETGEPFETEFRMSTKDGDWRWILGRGRVVARDAQGNAVRMLGTHMDITERKRTEEELAQVFAMSLDMICIADLETATFLKVNPAFTQTLGYSEKELLQKPFFDFIHPDDIAATHAVMDEKLLQGVKIINFENRYRCQDGSYRWLNWTSQPNPRLGVTYAVARDVTEWKETQYKLEENKRLLDAASHMVRTGGWELKPDTLEVKWTEETHRIHEVPLGYTPPLDKAIEFFHPEDQDRLSQAIEQALTKGAPYDLEVRFITAKGNHLWARTICEPEVENGRVVNLRGIFQDITQSKLAEEERKHLQDQLVQSQKMDALGTLASGIAHDFNNILAAIMGYSELALAQLSKDQPIHKDVEQITKAAVKAKSLIRQILTFSRKEDAQKQPLSLNEVINDAISILSRTLPKMIRLELKLQSDLNTVEANPQQLEQILVNLSSNAADAIEDTGSITITTKNAAIEGLVCDSCGETFSGDFVLLSFQDTGQGMSSETKTRIFDPFFTTKEVGKGTGLGLSTVFGIVTGHGGHITCNTQVGTGTVFNIFLPVSDQKTSETNQTAEKDDDYLGGSETILVVDDEEMVRDIAQRLLTSVGYQVLLADSGENALKIYQDNSEKIGVVLLDLGMPGMGGKACLDRICQTYQDAKVLIASGYIQYERTDELEALGAIGMVSKPYRKNEMLKQIRSALNE